MSVSVCMATFNRPQVLRKTLESIAVQELPLHTEVIVVDDGSKCWQENETVCREFGYTYKLVVREPVYRNPAVARNLAYKLAKGEIVVAQSDDVLHGNQAVRGLSQSLKEGEFVLATVWNVNQHRRIVGLTGWPHIKQLAGPLNRRPLFFLGALRRRDLYAIGGCDEEFTMPGREDVWFADCLIRGLRLTPCYSSVVGFHQNHARPESLSEQYRAMSQLYCTKLDQAKSGLAPYRGGEPWPYP
jgi:glycosyltransferase involved in cell wall biosynthesis